MFLNSSNFHQESYDEISLFLGKLSFLGPFSKTKIQQKIYNTYDKQY